MKSQLLDIYHKAGFPTDTLENGDWLAAGWDRENQVDFIQIWFGDMHAPIVSYEKFEDAWEFWLGLAAIRLIERNLIKRSSSRSSLI
ncbi:hypothetical protein [Enterococcus larvae]|uniref:hypothetical protein n=1 Tax=Enterococcus larvae TaxID=2794352 RepID=UPI003F3FA20A